MGAEPIIAVDVMQNKLSMAQHFGATHCVDSTQQDPVEVIREITDGEGAHYAFEMVGIPKVMSQAFDCLRIGGTVVVAGLGDPNESVTVPAVPLVVEEKRLIGSLYGSSVPRLDVPRLLDLYLAGKLNLDDLITKTWPLEQINEAYEALLRGEVARSLVTFD